MSRHSKNATSTTHFTYRERVAAGHGTLKRRFGRDSQLPFGVCCLCLATTHLRSPLVSPGGFVYCKECIYANLLAQKRSIQDSVAAYERFMETQGRKKQDEALQKERETLQKALNAVEGALTGKTAQDLDQARALATQKLKEKVDRATDDDKREAMKKTSFWIPDCTPTQETKVDKPDTKTRDPMSLEEMKLKHLMPVKFEWDTSAAGGKPKVLCAVTKKEISHHRAVLLRPSGQVILESCLKDMVLPTMTCSITGLKLRKKDIVHLQAGGTGFSAHSTVEAKKYRPTMT
ncbi:Nitric oxide synthase-interacting protein, zinc-finger [Phytophthora cactorum]|nr:Nitric oxide synthase-interacting protein, zinc-finger [Phytophthora cactorum]